jgi:hypothetical protein
VLLPEAASIVVKMSSHSYTQPAPMLLFSRISPNPSCPCGSKRKAKRCGLALNGSLKPLPSKATRPPGPPTGFGHPRCGPFMTAATSRRANTSSPRRAQARSPRENRCRRVSLAARARTSWG